MVRQYGSILSYWYVSTDRGATKGLTGSVMGRLEYLVKAQGKSAWQVTEDQPNALPLTKMSVPQPSVGLSRSKEGFVYGESTKGEAGL